MKINGRVDVYTNIFLTSVLDGGELPASCPDCFTSSTHQIRGWVGPRADLDNMTKRKFFTLPRHELHLVRSCYTNSAISAPRKFT
jgi:hypothetical protein